MTVNPLHSSHVLRGDNGRLPRTFVGDDAAQMDDAVTHDHAEAERTPIVLLKRIDQAVANVVIVGGRVGNLAGQARHCLQRVGARNDADNLFAAHHREPLDLFFP
jgi:hypothetical protein